MPVYEVSEPTIELHQENKFFYGTIASIAEEPGNYGVQLKWVIHLDDETYTDDGGVEQPRETWTWCSSKLTTHEKNKFRKYVKGLLGKEPQKGELFDIDHYTLEFYQGNPDKDPMELTGLKEPWRVAVMFEHGKKPDGSPKESISMLVSKERLA